jgi:hypothetical protein
MIKLLLSGRCRLFGIRPLMNLVTLTSKSCLWAADPSIRGGDAVRITTERPRIDTLPHDSTRSSQHRDDCRRGTDLNGAERFEAASAVKRNIARIRGL